MNKYFRIWIPLAAAFFLFAADAQPGSERASIEQFFRGYRFALTYKEAGRPIYGTFTEAEIHFCPSGRYVSYGRNTRNTVMDNRQVSNWSDAGAWDVGLVQGAPALRYLSTSGSRDAVQVRLTADGGVTLNNGANLRRLGRSTCR